jgi:predicted nucleotidyltransferase
MIIREKDRKNIIELAKRSIKTPSKILAYGSRVNGKAHDMSDLDLVIVSDNGKTLNINELNDFKEKLRDSNIPILVQVMDWYRIPESFHENILNNYIELLRISDE